jgi:GDP-L-fucose synthase
MLSYINVGTGVDCTIKELVETVAKVVGFLGEVKFGPTKLYGALRKIINVELVRLAILYIARKWVNDDLQVVC